MHILCKSTDNKRIEYQKLCLIENGLICPPSGRRYEEDTKVRGRYEGTRKIRNRYLRYLSHIPTSPPPPPLPLSPPLLFFYSFLLLSNEEEGNQRY